MTEQQIKRVKETWEPVSKEPLVISEIKGTIYAFGSELAVLRLYHKMKTGRVDYSYNLASWFYALEMKF